MCRRGGECVRGEGRGATGQAPKWAPPKGLLECVEVPEHGPEQMAFLHKPSGIVLMLDTILNLGSGVLPHLKAGNAVNFHANVQERRGMCQR